MLGILLAKKGKNKTIYVLLVASTLFPGIGIALLV